MADTVEGCQHQTTWGSDKCIYCEEAVGGKGVAPSPARRGLDLLLARFPAAEVQAIDVAYNRLNALVYSDTRTPWLAVDLSVGDVTRRFAIWKNAGDVYECDEYGAVGDEPVIYVRAKPPRYWDEHGRPA